MQSSTSWSLSLFLCVAAVLTAGLPLAAKAGPAIPDPCKLVTVAEIQQLVGPLKGTPKQGDIASGDVSCEYTPAAGPAWIDVRLQEGELSYWRKRNGGPNAVSLPEFGKDAFVDPDSDGSTDLYAKKGNLVLRVSLPKGPKAVDTVKAIAKKALTRL
jgi:hypothetical protein